MEKIETADNASLTHYPLASPPQTIFGELAPATLQGLIERAQQLDPAYEGLDPAEWATLDIPNGISLKAAQADLRAALGEPVLVYAEPPPAEPPAVEPNDDRFSWDQTYLKPDGINAHYAWKFEGGAGQGQAIVDLEQGWHTDHADLIDHQIAGVSGSNQDFHNHGTQVLGVVVAVDNDHQAIGIAPATGSVRWVSEWRTANTHSRADAVLSAAAAMAPGDILLIESQSNVPPHGMLPIEVAPLTWEAIRLATALGIVVVEAAGNGGVNLDALPVESSTMVLDRDHAEFDDSGAILVAASKSTAPFYKLPQTNTGNRVDCFAWGQEVATIDDSTTTGSLSPSRFGGTSSAAAIVAGAALSTQGIYQANLGQRLNSREMRELLGGRGTASAEPDRVLGVMPDLRQVIEAGEFDLPDPGHLRPAV